MIEFAKPMNPVVQLVGPNTTGLSLRVDLIHEVDNQ